MKLERERLIDIFVELGERLSTFGSDSSSNSLAKEAFTENSWFLPSEVVSAIGAIQKEMLDRELLVNWLNNYPTIETPKNVAIIMAGNIPLVGFFDLLCVLTSGHNCYIKPSSKDAVLTNYIVELLRDIEPNIGIYEFEDSELDAIIATGSDNTNRYFRSQYADIPSLLRGSRSSVAILTGSENDKMLRHLTEDVFRHSGLGCRNVSHLLVPDGYDFSPLIGQFNTFKNINPKLKNNFIQRRALLKMQKEQFNEGEFFMLRKNPESSTFLSEITYDNYQTFEMVEEWLKANEGKLQCVVLDRDGCNIEFSRIVEFGQSHSPTLTDYADDVDTMLFLLSLGAA